MIAAGNSLQHVAIIMDSLTERPINAQHPERVNFHSCVESALTAIHTCNEQGIKILTLLAVDDVAENIPSFVETLYKRMTCCEPQPFVLKVIGEPCPVEAGVPDNKNPQWCFVEGEENPFVLVIAHRYSCKQDILQAVRKIADQPLLATDIDEGCFDGYLSTAGLPAPDLLIRTGGKKQVGNFLLWQCAYSEFYFTETSWFRFGREHLLLALQDFTSRQRRFGKTSEQVEAEL